MAVRWFDRTFEHSLTPEAAPGVLARLRAAPGRLADAVDGLPEAVLTHRPGSRWSIQENVGHLLDLEPLLEQRLDDFDRSAAVLHAADIENRKTHEASHNRRSIDDLLSAFRRERLRVLARLERMTAADLARIARHPRLQRDMSVVDLCFFVAEHDDHHLATIREIAQALASMPLCAVELLNAVDRAEPALWALDDAVTVFRPAAGKWSAREIIGHLVDSASINHQRFVRAMFQDDLVFSGYAQDDWVAIQKYQEASWRELVALWATFNRHLARVMGAVPQSTRTRLRTRHNLREIAFRPVPEGEPATLDYLMHDYVAHVEHHLRQIHALVEGRADLIQR